MKLNDKIDLRIESERKAKYIKAQKKQKFKTLGEFVRNLLDKAEENDPHLFI